MDTHNALHRALLAARLKAQDVADYQLFRIYARAKLNTRGRMMILSGLAGFNRNVNGA